MRFFNIFKRKEFKVQPKQLRIDGTKATLTPTPDDAELAAQALLELRIYGDKTQRRKKQPLPKPLPKKEGKHDAEYYQELSERIKASREQEARSAMRYVAYVEQELTSAVSRHCVPHSDLQVREPSDFAELEHGLFKFQDVIDREGGELKSRWQRCLAECVVKQMTDDEGNPETN